MKLAAPALIVLPLLALCVGCSSSGAPAAAHSGAASSESTAATTGGTSDKTAAPVAASGKGITLTGAFTATVTVNLCAADGASITVKVAGDSQKYLGVISAKSFGFVGPGAADYSLAAGQPKPTASAGDTVFTVSGVELKDLVSGKTVTASGSVSCP